MGDIHMKEMELLLEKLNLFRNFPRFQLERHFDIILMDYIPKILNEMENGKTEWDFAVPEFPISIKQLNGLELNDNSTKESKKFGLSSIAMDYAVFDIANKKVALVELKTDRQSNRKGQDENLKFIKNSMSTGDIYNFLNERIKMLGSNNVTKMKYENILNYINFKGFYFDTDNPEQPLEVYKITPQPENTTVFKTYSFSQISNKSVSDKINCEIWKKLIAPCLAEWIESPKKITNFEEFEL